MTELPSKSTGRRLTLAEAGVAGEPEEWMPVSEHEEELRAVSDVYLGELAAKYERLREDYQAVADERLRLREAAEMAREDLLKAANQLAGLGAALSAGRFEQKAERLRVALNDGDAPPQPGTQRYEEECR